MSRTDFDFVIVGGGFYGCCLALFLRSLTDRILLVEAGGGLLERASRVNQARIHSGFHYPRSFVTALRSRVLQERFVRDFEAAVLSDFDMLYAIAQRQSKVSASRFRRMFEDMGASILPASGAHRALFDMNVIEDVFLCKEFAFDWSILRSQLLERLEKHQIPVRFLSRAETFRHEAGRCVVGLSSGEEITAGHVFNVTYAAVNGLLAAAKAPLVNVKHELAELALVVPPAEFENLAVTVMDGPFFSIMPYPSERLYSLTHVRYTPHFSWVDPPGGPAADFSQSLPRNTRWRHMMHDARRYVPCLSELRYVKSVFDVKTVLVKNERDDGRPILLHRDADSPRLITVMGAKIDNIYDLFDILPRMEPSWQSANTSRLFE